MSSIKSNNLQIGLTGGPSKVFTLHTSGPSDGGLLLSRGDHENIGATGLKITQDDYALTKVPLFSVYRNTAQSLPASTTTRVAINAVDGISDYWADEKFTPQIAGWYAFHGAVACPSGTLRLFSTVYKNGSEHTRGSDVAFAGANGVFGSQVSGVIYMNGSTDYLDLRAYTSAAVNLEGNIASTYFRGYLVRAAL